MKGLKTTVHKEALSRCSLQVLTRASNVRDVKGTLVLDHSLFANAQSCRIHEYAKDRGSDGVQDRTNEMLTLTARSVEDNFFTRSRKGGTTEA